MMIKYHKSLLVLIIFLSSAKSQQCLTSGRCRCTMNDGSGTINLAGITQTANSARFTVNDGYYSYSYNPCKGFQNDEFNDLAILQFSSDRSYDLGVQSNEQFNLTQSAGMFVHYTSSDQERTSRVNLICNRNLPIHMFYFVGELIIKEYDFLLEGPCACPNGCDENGVIVPSTNSDTRELKWNVVGYDLVSLIFHDMIVCFIFVLICFLMFYFCNKTLVCFKEGSATGFGNVNFSSKA